VARWVTSGRAWALVAVGLVAIGWAAFHVGRYRPNPFDHDDPLPCASWPEGCPSAAEVEAIARTAWWMVGAGVLLVLVGVALTVWRSSSVPRERPPTALSPWLHAVRHAVVAAVGVGLLLVMLMVPLVATLFLGPQAIPAGVLAAWLAQAGVLAGLDSFVGDAGTPRRSWATALLVSAAALGAVAAAWSVDVSPADPWWTTAAVAGTAAGFATLLVRLLTSPLPPGVAGRLRRAGAAGAVLLLSAGAVLVAGDLLREPRPLVTADRPPVPPSRPEPQPVTTAPLPPPASTPPAPPVAADVPCDPADLRFAVTGFDAAMGARAASVQATNAGTAPCWVEGVPVVTLRQGGRPLHLTVEPGQTPQGEPATAQRVGIAPGGRALALLTWRSYGGWADAETPQALTVALDPASPPVAVGLPPSDVAPFDLADGGAWGVAPWAPPWN
jgi:hypothetical protein